MGQSIQLGLPGIPAPTHTESAVKFHSIEVDRFGAKVIWLGVHVERYPTVEMACAAVEARNV